MTELIDLHAKMELSIYVQLIFLCTVNVIFTFTGTILNSLVILSLWKSSRLRKKLCYFMILVLSSFDLLAGMINHPLGATYSVVWLNEKYDLLSKLGIYIRPANMLLAFSMLTIVVMSFDQYLATAYPIYHRTSVTKTRLLILLSFFLLFDFTLYVITFNDFILPFHFNVIIFFAVVFPPFFFTNYKLFRISREMSRKNRIIPKKRTVVDLKNISSCLLVVACFVILSIPAFVYTILRFAEKPTSVNVQLSWVWGSTIASMNGTCNCLIFFWKNKLLRAEGIKVLKLLKNRQYFCTT